MHYFLWAARIIILITLLNNAYSNNVTETLTQVFKDTCVKSLQLQKCRNSYISVSGRKATSIWHFHILALKKNEADQRKLIWEISIIFC